ncbi:MAG: NAD(P)/FAD-dependent oxidoreductase [Gallionellaceae bacterium]|nr:NAD(P)/FAD-dependent oxidoreductase [Gallionellaceae bacterium]
MINSSSLNQGSATSCEVLVIGGGPAGSTAAALLAMRGRQVVLLEKSRHPRFHIGESLLPLNMPLFEQLGVAEEIKRIGMVKRGVEFVSPWHSEPAMIDFSDAVASMFPSAYQVRRSEFDHILFKNAIAKGAQAMEGCKVTGIEFHEGQGATVTAQTDDQKPYQIHARFVVDASGRDTFLAHHFDIKKRNKKHNSAAIFGHFSGATRLQGEVEGNITVFWFDHGWFWFIPLADGTTSVGATCWPYYLKSRKTEPAQFLLDTIALCPALVERLKHAKLISPVTATGNFSYIADRAFGQNYILIGDAFTFIDPVFSSGVFLAMSSAFMGADTVGICLDHPAHAAKALRAFERAVQHGPRVFSWFIYRVNTPAMRELLMYKGVSRIKNALISVLAGDVYRDTPIKLLLFMFKVLYYMKSIKNLPGSMEAWKKRKLAVRNLEA